MAKSRGRLENVLRNSPPMFQLAIETMFSVRQQANSLLHADAVATVQDGAKHILVVDKTAETDFRGKLLRGLSDRVEEDNVVLGEELLSDKAFEQLNLEQERIERQGNTLAIVERPESRTVWLVDMIDGSDLLKRGFGNWCGAVVCFAPSEKKLHFALIHDAHGHFYCSSEWDREPFVLTCRKRGDWERQPMRPLSEAVDPALCFYTQKPKNFLSTPIGLLAWISSQNGSNLRIYNLAGNPMMARLANSEDVTIVLDHSGQLPHDAVPGAYVALKAGATLVNIEDGGILTEVDLVKALITPSKGRLKYVLAARSNVAQELAAAIRNAKGTVGDFLGGTPPANN